MRLWSFALLLTTTATSFSVSLALTDHGHPPLLLEEFGRIVRAKYEPLLDTPLTPEGKEQIDRLFDAAVPLSLPSSHRGKRAANEVKEEQLLLDGIMDYGSIPMDFSRELCMFQVEDLEYAAVVHSTNISNKENSTRLVILRKTASREFVRIYNISIPYIVSLDCITFDTDGFVSAAVNLCPENNNVHLYSPIFRVQKQDRVEIVEKNTWWRQRTARLWKYGNDLFLMYTFRNDPSYDSISGAFLCPIFKFSAGFLFEIWKEIPCSNAIRVEAFSIISDMYVAVANSRDAANNTETNTVVYKFDLNLDKFVAYQNILVNRIVDLRYFTFKISEQVTSFLVITSASLVDSNEVAEVRREGLSVIVIYAYVEELFLPLQNILIERPTQVLPHIWDNKEMVLLIASEVAPVRFYHYIGWKFEDTALAEAPSAFETGVSSMRNYVDAKGDSLVLLANSEHFGSTPNLFKFHFKVNSDPDLYQGILGWCDQSVSELQDFDYARVLDELTAIHEQQRGMLKELVLQRPLVLDGVNVTVERVVADRVEGDEVLERAAVENEKLRQIRELVEEMERKLVVMGEQMGGALTREQRDEVLRSAQAREVELDVLEVDEVVTQHVNGKPIDLWAHSDEDLLVGDLSAPALTVHGGALHMKAYEGVLASALRVNGDQEISFPLSGEGISVDHLSVSQSINDNDIQAITTVMRQMAEGRDEITVDEVEVGSLNGRVNGRDWREVDRVTLKSNGDQTIDGRFEVDELVAGSSAEILGTVGGHSLNRMIVIGGGGGDEKELVIERSVNFENSALFHDLHVTGRMGSVKVRGKGGFDVLMKRWPHTQIMRGETQFDEVKLLEPITLHGKIANSPLSRMNPNVVVDGEVVLTGDYEIRGPVTVKRRLATRDLYGADGKRSLGELKNFGIRLNQDVIEGDMVFNQPLRVGQLQVNSIRGVPIDSLLRSGLKGGPDQIVTGRKIFTAPLVTVEGGTVDVMNVNGINIEEFSKTVLTRTGDQNITGNIHFNQIDAHSITSNYVSLGGRDIRQFYARDKDIHVPGTVHFRGTLRAKSQLKIGALYPSRRVFEQNFTELAQDTVFRYDKNVKVTGRKIFTETLNVRNLKTSGAFANLSRVPLDGILRFKLEGDLLANRIQCGALHVHHSLNGIAANQFGHLWLSTEGDQIFTAPQTFHNLNAERVRLYGQLEENGVHYDVNNALQGTFLTNRREVVGLPRVVFEYLLETPGNLQVLGRVNGVRLPEDLLLRNATLIDVLHVKAGDVRVRGQLVANGWLNGVPLDPLFNFTLNDNPYVPMNLKVQGSLEFLREPLISHVDNISINALYENAWMLYHSRDLNGDVHFEELHLGAEVMAGAVNGRDLPHFVANRFSLREAQRVAQRLHFVDEVVTHGVLKTDWVRTGDEINVGKANVPINLRFFSENALKKDTARTDPQHVTGDWHFKELIVNGDLEGVLVNGLNLVDDVVHRSYASNIVYGQRSFEDLHIEHLHCGEFCYVQGVNLNSWMLQSVYLEGNHSVQGITVLESPEVLGNIRVFGSVNGQKRFDRESVLCDTGNQHLNVSLSVNSHFDGNLHQLTVRRLDTDQVNGQRIWRDSGDESVLVTYQMSAGDVVETPVAFREKLVVEELSLEGDTLFGVSLRDVQRTMGVRRLLEEQTRGFEDLVRVVERATKQAANGGGGGAGGRYVKHFHVLQRIRGGDLRYVEPLKRWTNSSGIHDHLLVVIDGADLGRLTLLGYNATANAFGVVGGADFARDIVAFRVLSTETGRQLVWLQTRGAQEQSLLNSLFVFDGHSNQFKLVYEFQSSQPIQVEVVQTTGRGDVLLQYSPSLDTIDLFEVKWISEGAVLGLQRRGGIAKRGVKTVVGLGRDQFVLLVERKQVEIWRFDGGKDEFEQQFVLPALIDPVAVATCPFGGHHFIAVQCAGNVVEISLLVEGNKLKRYQTLQINDPVLQLRFVRMTSGELMLAVSTGNGQRPLVVFRYAGLSLFVERLGYSKMGASSSSGRRISDLMVIGGGGERPRNFMIMVAAREAVILEAITER